MMTNQTNKDGWISVEDRLPDEFKSYLCMTNMGIQIELYHPKYKHFCVSFGKKVTDWMPLPSPPEKKGK
jgi:hypothetical protein